MHDGATVPSPSSVYWEFYDEVARRQVLEWQPDRPGRVLDLSVAHDRWSRVLRDSGHEVLRVAQQSWGIPTVDADRQSLGWLQDDALDGVLADAAAVTVAFEADAADLARVLRPGGRLLLVVESLTSGLSRLAGSGRWAELADLPGADVVLVPGEDGSVTRCFSPQELLQLLHEAGFVVEWVRPRSVLTPRHVERVLDTDPRALGELVRTELALAREQEGEAPGLHLVASARLPL